MRCFLGWPAVPWPPVALAPVVWLVPVAEPFGLAEALAPWALEFFAVPGSFVSPDSFPPVCVLLRAPALTPAPALSPPDLLGPACAPLLEPAFPATLLEPDFPVPVAPVPAPVAVLVAPLPVTGRSRFPLPPLPMLPVAPGFPATGAALYWPAVPRVEAVPVPGLCLRA